MSYDSDDDETTLTVSGADGQDLSTQRQMPKSFKNKL